MRASSSGAARRRLMLWRKGIRQCARCGGELQSPDQSTLEHIIPKSVGGRTTRSNLTLSHPDCNRRAGQALWLKVRGEPGSRTAKKGPVTPEFWYQDLIAAAPSSRVPKPSEEFQIIGAIEHAVTLAEGSEIRALDALLKQFGEGRWLKRKGQAVVRLSDGTICRAELHWYEAHGIGRRLLKIKRRLQL